MNYIHKLLMKDEKVLYFTKPHWILYKQAILWFIITLFLLVFGPSLRLSTMMFGYPLYKVGAFLTLIFTLVYAIPAYFKITFSEIALTNRRLIIKTGFMETRSVEILLPKIESVQVLQPLLGKMFDFGSIIVHGVGGSKDTLGFVPQPEKVRNAIQVQAEAWTKTTSQK